jgi:hypothetical protein
MDQMNENNLKFTVITNNKLTLRSTTGEVTFGNTITTQLTAGKVLTSIVTDLTISSGGAGTLVAGRSVNIQSMVGVLSISASGQVAHIIDGITFRS